MKPIIVDPSWGEVSPSEWNELRQTPIGHDGPDISLEHLNRIRAKRFPVLLCQGEGVSLLASDGQYQLRSDDNGVVNIPLSMLKVMRTLPEDTGQAVENKKMVQTLLNVMMGRPTKEDYENLSEIALPYL